MITFDMGIDELDPSSLRRPGQSELMLMKVLYVTQSELISEASSGTMMGLGFWGLLVVLAMPRTYLQS